MYLDKIVIGSRVAPKEGLMVGFGVVTDIILTKKPELKIIYEVLTDFGNFLKFTESEFISIYTNEIYYDQDYVDGELTLVENCAVDNLQERLERQILNLQMAQLDLENRGLI